MSTTLIDPLGTVGISPAVARLPKADIHVHQEWSQRLDRVLARAAGRPSYDWRAWAARLMGETPPGPQRLAVLSTVQPAPQAADAEPEAFIARIGDLLEEAAADGAVLVEVRCGNEEVLRPEAMALFREAERRVQARFPALRAEMVVPLLLWFDEERLERVMQGCLAAARQGLGGLDFLYRTYHEEAEWEAAYRLAARAQAAGLGITVHAGEFSSANLAAALRMPGLTRIGHGVHAAYDEPMLDELARRAITIECCLTSNVILGAAPSYEGHPLRRFLAAGVPVALCTDDPVQLCTTIGREYSIAAALGFSESVLLDRTEDAVRAAFTTPSRKTAILAEIAAARSRSATPLQPRA